MQTSMLSYNGASGAVVGASAGMSAGMDACAPGPLKLIIGGVIYTAKTGIDYRAFK